MHDDILYKPTEKFDQRDNKRFSASKSSDEEEEDEEKDEVLYDDSSSPGTYNFIQHHHLHPWFATCRMRWMQLEAQQLTLR